MKVLVVGDECYDVSVYGRLVDSSESGIDKVYKADHGGRYTKAGMAGNLVKCLKTLGVEVVSITTPEIDRCTKVRHYYSIDQYNYSDSYKVYARVDTDKLAKTPNSPLPIPDNLDAIVVSDYAKGFVSYDLIKGLEQFAKNLNIPFFIDTKKRELSFLTRAIIKINTPEFNNLYSIPTGPSVALIVTQGENGAKLYSNEVSKDIHLEFKPENIKDTCGAGDAFFAGLIAAHLTGNTLEKSIVYGNRAGVASTFATGTQAPSMEEVFYD